MSVALLDHGEIVPGRGITNRIELPNDSSFETPLGLGPYSRSEIISADSAATKSASQSTK
jgi:hypothetical protein